MNPIFQIRQKVIRKWEKLERTSAKELRSNLAPFSSMWLAQAFHKLAPKIAMLTSLANPPLQRLRACTVRACCHQHCTSGFWYPSLGGGDGRRSLLGSSRWRSSRSLSSRRLSSRLRSSRPASSGGGGGFRRSYGGGLGRPRLHCLTVWFAGRSPWFTAWPIE